ncbi:hypothetical protein M092_2618 [Parabacteroides distasonis str. 3776 D15 iv]|uniref:Uncharacterized protein n=1 Tax=Parabacteroides distasonis str. 3776 D15 i TaxID=1339342 RepID=A0AB34LEG2_PARDI|nr:hypothetical protein M091_1071 [Parabacteroides distasonis str. 3776 D15 i]KDS46383.1 hypothetical protein M090_3854 [Parabacteroides distasonis str. 3776 Po2 i]KDS70518.1 hypothetical protein M092_2618 [Parabacteroides distasonis str. 3776 D15 iv]
MDGVRFFYLCVYKISSLFCNRFVIAHVLLIKANNLLNL